MLTFKFETIDLRKRHLAACKPPSVSIVGISAELRQPPFGGLCAFAGKVKWLRTRILKMSPWRKFGSS